MRNGESRALEKRGHSTVPGNHLTDMSVRLLPELRCAPSQTSCFEFILPVSLFCVAFPQEPVSEAELEALRGVFALFDTDGTGEIDSSEFATILSKVGRDPSEGTSCHVPLTRQL